jgi:hypothetical protein
MFLRILLVLAIGCELRLHHHDNLECWASNVLVFPAELDQLWSDVACSACPLHSQLQLVIWSLWSWCHSMPRGLGRTAMTVSLTLGSTKL